MPSTTVCSLWLPGCPVSAGGLDVDDVTGCPVAQACGTCGAAGGGLAVYPVETPVGVCCVTLCGGCVDAGALPRFPVLGGRGARGG